MNRRPSVWALGAVSAAAVVVALVLANADAAVRAPAVLAFVFVFPGLAVVRPLRLSGDRLTELVLGVALSVAIAVVVPTGLLYLGWWSPNAALAMLVGVTLAGAAVELSESLRTATRTGPVRG